MMKESIKNCFENAETERLNGFFEKYKGEQMPEESLARLREKMLGEGVKKPLFKGFSFDNSTRLPLQPACWSAWASHIRRECLTSLIKKRYRTCI